MCGISGIVNRRDRKVKEEEIKKINDLIKHRGPDDEGFYFGSNFAFGHRRLAIIDLSEAGHQPMHYSGKNGQYTITYNGEVYNYLEIKETLLKEGYTFSSDTDTEVILAAYDKWGERCVEHFNGMWAFAIYDKAKEILFCSRDRFGIKPFYYTQVGDRFVFGSEIKQLLPFQESIVCNRSIAVDYIVTGIQEHNNETFFENIYKLEAAHNLIYDLNSHTYRHYNYYTISFDHPVTCLQTAIEEYKEEFRRAISYRLRSDVKVGTCLSGGLDSSSVAAVASKLYTKNSGKSFTAIHAKSTEKETDESSYAAMVAQYCGLDLHMIEPSAEAFRTHIDEVVYTQEEPFGSPSIFMQYFVMKKAREEGCVVMLDGQGGDETLLGYEKYYPSAYVDIFRRFGFFRALQEIRNSHKNNTKMTLLWIAKYTIGSLFATLRKLEYKRRTRFMRPYRNRFGFLDDLASAYLRINALQNYEIKYTNLPILLRYEDKNSMRHSVETRLPFLDYRTLEKALNIDILHKIKEGWTKYILRRVIENLLPEEVVWRKNKLGFNAPERSWIGRFQTEIREEIVHSKILEELTYKGLLLKQLDSMEDRLKWRLYNIAVWERVYHVKLG